MPVLMAPTPATTTSTGLQLLWKFLTKGDIVLNAPMNYLRVERKPFKLATNANSSRMSFPSTLSCQHEHMHSISSDTVGTFQSLGYSFCSSRGILSALLETPVPAFVLLVNVCSFGRRVVLHFNVWSYVFH